MSEQVRRVNSFFRDAIRSDVDGLPEELLLTDRQKRIFTMFYIERKDISFISDTVFISPRAVEKELRTIRRKIVNKMQL